MATLAPPALVVAPARAPLAFGLGSVLSWRTGDRWEAGVSWDTITCEPASGRGGPACDPDVAVRKRRIRRIYHPSEDKETT